MLEHGGRRRAAAERYGIPETDWLDLSTGILPFGYPVPAIPSEVWQRLPETDDGLERAASAYYGTTRLLPLAGSQQAIQALPKLLPPGRVAVLQPTYAEHGAHWIAARHTLQRFDADALEAVAASADTVVVCNPNNPDGALLVRERLLAAAQELARRGGRLLVDEAFIDAMPDFSVAELAGCETCPSLIVLRSLGKFFGLAGARVGFLVADAELRAAMCEELGPWPLAGPARYVAQTALCDAAWQTRTRLWLIAARARLERLVAPLAIAADDVREGFRDKVGDPVAADAQRQKDGALFVWLPTPRAEALADALARQSVLVRCFIDGAATTGLRFGLPGPEEDWRRLAFALETVRCA